MLLGLSRASNTRSDALLDPKCGDCNRLRTVVHTEQCDGRLFNPGKKIGPAVGWPGLSLGSKPKWEKGMRSSSANAVVAIGCELLSTPNVGWSPLKSRKKGPAA
jgi:hypothetical protein